jgi:hypothetical protein
MDEWFKARLIWHKGIEALSDAEAGRLAKALWKFAATGEVENLGGGEKFAFAMCRATLEQDMQRRDEISEVRSKAGKNGAKQKKANGNKISNCFSEKANESKKNNCPQKEIRNKNNIPPYNPPTGGIGGGEDELLAISEQNNRVYDKAQACGFVCNMATLDRLTALIASHGADSVFSALDECVKAQASNFRYLEKVLENKKAESKTKAVSYETFF